VEGIEEFAREENMRLDIERFYEVLAPRPAILISTVDREGRSNAAPFSFITPVSISPPLVLFAAVPTRHTLANVRETGDFVLNLAPEKLLEKLWICSKAFPRGVSEIREAGLTESRPAVVQAPRIAECVAWIECRYEFEKEAGDHILVVGRVVEVECRDECLEQAKLNLSQAKPLMHLAGRRFAVAERLVRVQE